MSSIKPMSSIKKVCFAAVVLTLFVSEVVRAKGPSDVPPEASADVFVPHPVVLKKRDVATLKMDSQAPDFRLRGVDDRWHSLADYDEAKVLALVFTCNHCPAAQKFEDDFNQMVKDYADHGVALVAISSSSPLGVEEWELGWSDVGDSYEDMKIRAKDREFLFPYLYDGDLQDASLAYGAMATPHVFVFDKERKLKYVGRPGLRPTKKNKLPGRATEMRAAIDALLAGQEVSPRTTPLVGCSTKWSWKNGHLSDPWNDWRKGEVTLEEIDLKGVQSLLANDSKRLRLVNVWATWCTTCIGEYSEFVKLHGIYHPRQIYDAKSGFEFVSICLDSPEKKPVAKRLLDRFESRVSNYLFDEQHLDDFVAAIDPDWNGALPYTLLVEPGGKVLYRCQGAADFVKLRKIIIEQPTMGRLQ